MEELAEGRYVVAPDLRNFGDSEAAPIDASRGLRDFSDDLATLVSSMGIIAAPFDILGWSLGGSVVMQVAIDHPGLVRRVVLEAPGSPHGFGGTRDVDGTPTNPDFSGSGGGTANPEFGQLISEGYREADNPAGPVAVVRAFYMAPGVDLDPELEAKYIDGLLKIRVGDGAYPGDSTPSEHWPGVAPGTGGINNALSPKYLDLSAYGDLDPAPPTLWIRGDADQIVSDTSLFCFGTLGSLGAVPDWPGADAYPSQPMIAQTRAVLGRGDHTEVVLEGCGHSPHIERRDEFVAAVNGFLA